MTQSNAAPDEIPLRAIRTLGVAVEKTIRIHEERCPLRALLGQPQAPPDRGSPDGTLNIPETSLAEMTNTLDREPHLDAQALSERFGIPAEIISREMPLYLARHLSRIASHIARIAG